MEEGDETGLIGGIEKREIRVVEYNAGWNAQFECHAAIIAAALGETALRIEHIGSTAVPGLAAKPIIDVLVVVADSSDESTYLPQMKAAGYVLRVREPEWHEHRMFRTPELTVHVHVYSQDCEEVDRVLAFRDRLRVDPDARTRYEGVKLLLAGQDWPDMNAYALAKTEVIESILSLPEGS